MENLSFIQCELTDLKELQTFSIETFVATYQADNSRKNLNDYIKKQLSTKQLSKEMTLPDSTFYFLKKEAELLAYLKINTEMAQTEEIGSTEKSLELERIYIAKKAQGQGLGRFLIDQVTSIATDLKKERIWLGAWEHNYKALAFYHKMGFKEISTHPFYMGNEKQNDLILEKTLNV
ncbi:MAG TPA: GNAT family N-acetyltransferase [Tetragenococcus sp.]|nr:GNAT family N-acetyltransferase [Tetragenococcus sp.]